MFMHLELVAAKKSTWGCFAGLPPANGQSMVCKTFMHPSCTRYSAGAQLTCEKQLTAAREELKWPGEKMGGLAANKYWVYLGGLCVPLCACPWEPMAEEHHLSPQNFVCPGVHRSTKPPQLGEERPPEHQGGRKMCSVTGSLRRDKGILKEGRGQGCSAGGSSDPGWLAPNMAGCSR